MVTVSSGDPSWASTSSSPHRCEFPMRCWTGRLLMPRPAVLPAALPINADPPRLLKKIEHQRAVVHRALARAGHRGRVDVIQCHSIAALARTLCAERDPAELVLAGRASWTFRRVLHAAPVTVISDRTQARSGGPL